MNRNVKSTFFEAPKIANLMIVKDIIAYMVLRAASDSLTHFLLSNTVTSKLASKRVQQEERD